MNAGHQRVEWRRATKHPTIQEERKRTLNKTIMIYTPNELESLMRPFKRACWHYRKHLKKSTNKNHHHQLQSDTHGKTGDDLCQRSDPKPTTSAGQTASVSSKAGLPKTESSVLTMCGGGGNDHLSPRVVGGDVSLPPWPEGAQIFVFSSFVCVVGGWGGDFYFWSAMKCLLLTCTTCFSDHWFGGKFLMLVATIHLVCLAVKSSDSEVVKEFGDAARKVKDSDF